MPPGSSCSLQRILNIIHTATTSLRYCLFILLRARGRAASSHPHTHSVPLPSPRLPLHPCSPRALYPWTWASTPRSLLMFIARSSHCHIHSAPRIPPPYRALYPWTCGIQTAGPVDVSKLAALARGAAALEIPLRTFSRYGLWRQPGRAGCTVVRGCGVGWLCCGGGGKSGVLFPSNAAKQPQLRTWHSMGASPEGLGASRGLWGTRRARGGPVGWNGCAIKDGKLGRDPTVLIKVFIEHWTSAVAGFTTCSQSCRDCKVAHVPWPPTCRPTTTGGPGTQSSTVATRIMHAAM